MPHVLARLTGAPLAAVKAQLQKDAPTHASQGMYLAHVWTNTDDPNEVLFLFRVDDLNHCKQLMTKAHAIARAADPNAKLPQLTFLEGA